MAHFRSSNSDDTQAKLVSTEQTRTEECDYYDTGPYTGFDPDAVTSVEVKIERNSEDEGIHYGGFEDLVDTVMETDPFDDVISFPYGHNDGEETEDNQPYACHICHRRFAYKYQLLEHEIIHSASKQYQCKACLRSYNRKRCLQTHIQRYHSGVQLFHCDCCPETFITISELRNHTKKHICEGFKCEICNCQFKRKDNYHRHLKVHSIDKERPFECPLCEKRFVEKPHLRNHLATHSDEKPFECKVCQCWFNRKGNLQRHMRRHTGEKPFECAACGRRFSQKLHLQNHFRRKHGEKLVEKSKGVKHKTRKKVKVIKKVKNENITEVNDNV